MAGARTRALGVFSSQRGGLQGLFPSGRALEDLGRAGGWSYRHILVDFAKEGLSNQNELLK